MRTSALLPTQFDGPRLRRTIVVAGGGLLGMLTALRLVDAGCTVTLIEPGELGGEASSAAAGILAADAEAPLPGALRSFSQTARSMWPALAARLRASSNVDIGYREWGVLAIGRDMASHYAAAVAEGDGRVLTSDEVLLHRDAQVDPASTVSALAALLCQNPLFRWERERLLEVTEDGLALTGSGSVAGDALVLTLGAWASQIAHPDGEWPQVVPVFGVLADLGLSLPPQPVRFSHQAYGLVRDDGRVTIGFSSEERGFNKAFTDREVAWVRERAEALFPEAKDAPLLRAWSGLRPKAVEDAPYIGPVSNSGKVWMAAGQHRNGILHAPLVAEHLASLACIEGTPFPGWIR